MAGSLGTIYGQIRLDVSNAIAGYAAMRAANARTINTLQDGSRRMRGFGLGATAMGASFLAGFGMAVNAAANFEKKLDYFGAVNNATAKEMEKVRAKALELGRTSAFSADQVADAFVEMGKAGVSAKDITDGMAEAMVNLASAADIDLAQATNIVTSQIQAFGLEAKDATHVVDLMAGAANASIIDIQDIGVSMKYVAGVAHSLSISVDDTTTAISLLGKAGIKGSTAGTSLRQIMVSLAGGSEKAKKQLRDLGIITADGSNKFFTAEGKAKSLGEIFQILQDHTANLSQKQRLSAFRTIFNNRALAAAQILTRKGAKGFKEMAKEISKTTAADVAAKRLDNLSGDIKKLKGNIDTLLIKAGTPFQKFLRSIVQGITKVVQWFANLPSGVQQAIMTFILITGVLATLLGLFALFGASLLGAGAAFRGVAAGARILWSVLTGLWGGLRLLAAGLAATPLGWWVIAIAAVIAVIVLLWNKCEGFRNVVYAIGRAIKAAFFATVEWFKNLPATFSSIWKSITNAFTSGVEWVKNAWNTMVNFITSAPGKIWGAITSFTSMVVNFMTSLPGKILSGLSTAWSAFTAFLSKLPYYIGFALGFVLGTLVKWGAKAGVWAAQTGVKVYNGIVNFFKKLPGRIASFLTSMGAKILSFSIRAKQYAVKIGTNVYNAVVDWFKKLPGRIQSFLVNMGVKIIVFSAKARAYAISLGKKVYNGVVDWFKKLPGRVASFLVSLGSKIISYASKTRSYAIRMGKSIYNGVIDYVKSMPSRIAGIIGSVISYFNRAVRRAFNAVKGFAKGLWDGFKSGLGIKSPSYIEKAMWAITNVTDRESKRLRGQVRGMQTLARGLQQVHDTTSGMGIQPDWMRALDSPNVRASVQALFAPSKGLDYSGARTALMAPSQTSSEAVRDQRPITVTVHNPVAERASDSAARKLRTLSAMGAFG